jgi:hypothetical protein
MIAPMFHISRISALAGLTSARAHPGMDNRTTLLEESHEAG